MCITYALIHFNIHKIYINLFCITFINIFAFEKLVLDIFGIDFKITKDDSTKRFSTIMYEVLMQQCPVRIISFQNTKTKPFLKKGALF